VLAGGLTCSGTSGGRRSQETAAICFHRSPGTPGTQNITFYEIVASPKKLHVEMTANGSFVLDANSQHAESDDKLSQLITVTCQPQNDLTTIELGTGYVPKLLDKTIKVNAVFQSTTTRIPLKPR
jgi:hypothetical protein